mgnify:CR=1 FL=1
MATQGARVTGIDLSEKGARRRGAPQARVGCRRRLPIDSCGNIGRRIARFVRRSHLHGNARACADAGSDHRCVRHAFAKPGGTVVFSTLNPEPKIVSVRGRRRRIFAAPATESTHDWARFLKPAEIAGWSRRAGLEPVEVDRDDLQPGLEALPAGTRHERQLPDCVSPSHRCIG